MNWERTIAARLALSLMLIVTGLAVADDFDLDWWTVDGGGDMWTVGGDYELSGTIGQPDAGVLTGGDYELTGGFWFSAPAGPAICRGDTNCDGTISYGDINPFVLALNNLSAWQTQFPGCPWQNCDVNGDGIVSYGDINPFVRALGSPGPCP